MKRPWLASIIVLALLIVGAVVYLARPRGDETDSASLHDAMTPAQPAAVPSAARSALAACVGPKDSQISQASLVDKHKWAHSLLLKGHLDAAVTEFRNIATLDPGYPAINLEISDALLKSRRPSDAKDAIRLQLEMSTCLSNLAAGDAEAYCKSEWETAPPGECVQELAKINQQAHYEAGVIDAELSRVANLHASPPTGISTLAPQSSRPIASPAPGAIGATQQNAAANISDETIPRKPPAPLKIQSSEASEHIGERATVCGLVVSKHTAEESNGRPTFVNLDRALPNPTFTIVIWGADSAGIGDFPASGNVCVTGTIATYRGNPQIILHDAKSWHSSNQP